MIEEPCKLGSYRHFNNNYIPDTLIHLFFWVFIEILIDPRLLQIDHCPVWELKVTKMEKVIVLPCL